MTDASVADLTPRDLADRILAGHPVSTAAHTDIARSATSEPDPDGLCRGCHEPRSTDAGCEPSALCHGCAQVFAEVLGRRVLESEHTIEALRRTIEEDHRAKVSLEAEANDLEARLGARKGTLAAIGQHLPALHSLRLAAAARAEEHERRHGVNASGRHLRDDLRAIDAVLAVFGEGAVDALGRLRR